ncbi:MAG TPA: endonuclease domain-containing protein [Bacteroidales bacterium]|nr:endonuclease domain-containing protein [Bacteroidales bacterium]
MKYNEIRDFARKLRKNPTPSEQKLWEEIRFRKLNGRKFLRQHPIIFESKNNEHFFYIPDFYCAEEKLVIELDGPIHMNQQDHDKQRDLILKEKGLKILRIKNHEIKEMEKVVEKIRSTFK